MKHLRPRLIIALVCLMLTTGFLVRYADAIWWFFKYGSGLPDAIGQDISAIWTCVTGDCSALTAGSGDSFDAGSASTSRPATRSTTLGATCAEGQFHMDTDSGGTETYVCTGGNVWVKLGDDTGGSSASPPFDSLDPGATNIFPIWDDTGGEIDWQSAAVQRTALGVPGLATENTYTGHQNIGDGRLTPPNGTVAAMLALATPQFSERFDVTDGISATDCDTGGGSTEVPCRYSPDEGGWVALGAGGTVGEVDDFSTGAGRVGTSYDSLANALKLGGQGTSYIALFNDPTEGPIHRGYDSSGNPLTDNFSIFDGDPQITSIGNGAGTLQTCRTADADGTIIYAATESCRPTRSVFIPAGSLSVDGTQCTAPANTTLNAGPMTQTVVCADNDAGTIWSDFVMPDAWDAGTITVELLVTSDNAVPAGDYDIDFSALCRDPGTLINATVGTEVAADVDFDAGGSCGAGACAQWASVTVTTAAITPGGACAPGDYVAIRGQLDATGTTATVGDVLIIGLKIEYKVAGSTD